MDSCFLWDEMNRSKKRTKKEIVGKVGGETRLDGVEWVDTNEHAE